MNWKIGVELELLAPKGVSRRSLAEETARRVGGRVASFWHPQVEPSLVPNMPIFHNLTQGFRIVDTANRWVASYVGDLTISADLDRMCPSKPGWFRILSDDLRLIQLIARHAGEASNDISEALVPIANLFGTPLRTQEGITRVEGMYGSSIALGAQLPGERERVCEIVSSPMEDDIKTRLEFLLKPAREMGFVIPKESATHIHFCAKRLQNARVFRNLLEFLNGYRDVLRGIFKVNMNCIRLGGWPEELWPVVRRSGFESLPWKGVREALQGVRLTKFCDFNIKNMVYEWESKNTFELRILPGTMRVETVLEAAQIMVCIFNYVETQERIYPQSPKVDSAQLRQVMLNQIGWTGRDL